jgi:transcriptional regulator with XRE-family HTH domain
VNAKLNDRIEKLKADPHSARLIEERAAGMRLTETMKNLRALSRLSQTDLAKAVGRPQSFIGKLEIGAYERCSVATLTTISRAMGFELDFTSMFRMIEQPISYGEMDFEGDFVNETRALNEMLQRNLVKSSPAAFAFSEKQQGELLLQADDPNADAA